MPASRRELLKRGAAAAAGVALPGWLASRAQARAPEPALEIAAGSFQPSCRFTTRGDTLYALALGWPESGTVTIRSLAAPSPPAGHAPEIHLLGHKERLQGVQREDGLTIRLPAAKPCDHAFAFKIRGLASG